MDVDRRSRLDIGGDQMDRDIVIVLAREAGLIATKRYGPIENYERFAALVAAHERERILEMCKEGWWDGAGIRHHLEKQDAIRSRKE